MDRLLVLRTQRGIVLTLLLSASLAAFSQGGSEKRGGPDATDDAGRRAAWFLRGRTVRGKSAAALLRNAHQQKLHIRRQTQERLERAAAQANQASAGTGSTSATAPGGGVIPMTVPAGSAWVNLGPAPITALGRFGDASGRITSIAVDQSDSTGNTVYVAGAYGGVWKSTNAANATPANVTWTPIYDTDPAAVTLAAGAVSLHPTNSSVMLVGTGEPNNALDSYYGMGILRSTNGGASWTLISSATGGEAFDGMGVSKFAWKPDGSLVVAGLSNATNLGPGAGGGFQGIYYSTDGGATWTRATNATAGDTVFGSVSDVVYNVTLGKFFATLRKQGIYSSTNGSSWTRLANQPVTFAASCSNGGTPTCDMLRGQLTVRPGSAEMYAWIVGTDGTTNRGISRTTDGGTTGWSASAVGSGPGALSITGINTCGDTAGCGASQGFYNLVLAAVPNGANTDLYAGAVNLFKCANSNSTTCTTWLNLTHVYGDCNNNNSYLSIHPDQHAIDFLQSNTNIIYFGNDGGAYRSLTSKSAGSAGLNTGVCTSGTGNAFQDLNTSSLGSLTQFISISHHPTDDSVILGGTQDNGSPAIADGQASPPLNPPLWYEANGGDGGFNEIDQTNPNNWYTAFTDVTIQRCTTGTNCIETDVFSAAINNDSTAGTVNFNDHGDFYTPYILDPQLSSRVIIGTCRVWRGNADGTGFATNGPNATANRLSNKLLAAGGTTVCSTSETAYVSSLAAGGPLSAGNGSQVIYAGTSDGHIWVTTNATTGIATWTDRTGSTNPNGYVVSKVAIDTTDATGQTAYMTIMGFTGGGGHVFKTTNAGANWTDISAGLPDAPADSVVVDPIDHTIVYVGTDVGVFATNDGGANWSEFGTGLPNVATVALRTFNSGGSKKLRVGTHGRGVWETDLASGLEPAIAAVSVTPSSGTGSSQTFAFLYSEASGADKISYVQALINATNSWQNACAILYIQNGNQLYLVNNAGNGWQGPLTPGVAGTLQNNQCTLDAGGSSVSAVGNNLTVNAALTFKPAFGGNKVVLLDAEDTVNSLSSGFQSLGTWTVPFGPPTAVSVTPSSGTGSSQTFSFLYSDAGGVGRITYVQALINATNSWQNACAILYIQSGTQLYLVNNAGTGWQGPLTPGVAGTLQNNQCTLDAGASSVSAVGNNLTVNAALTFKPAFGGNKVVLLDAEDTVNHLSSGFQSLGTWTVPAAAPVAVSVTPSSGTGSSQTFAFLYSDAGGVSRITYVQALINTTNSWQNACAILYIQSGNQLYLVNNAGNGWQGPLTPGVAGTLQNNQCTLDAGASSVSAVGNNLTVNAALSFKPAFGGNKVVLLDAEDTVNHLSSGFQSLGTWTVPASAPMAVSVTPSSGTGSSQTFAFLYSDAGGVGRITYVQALINATHSWQNACAILYIQSGTQLYLVNDAGNGWQGPLTPGVAGTLQNNQCTLDAGASSVSAVGNNLTVNAALTFKVAFSGSKVVLLDAENTTNNLSSGFQSLGTWTVP